MAKLNSIKIDTHPRGDSGILRWSWVKQEADGSMTPLSLVGYKVAMTVKAQDWDMSPNDIEGASTAVGYNDILWMIDIDCDNPNEMHGLDPSAGKVLFAMPKQANWIEPGTYYVDIVVENKVSKRTTTVLSGTIEIQGHPTNRLTTDAPDTYGDITE